MFLLSLASVFNIQGRNQRAFQGELATGVFDVVPESRPEPNEQKCEDDSSSDSAESVELPVEVPKRVFDHSQDVLYEPLLIAGVNWFLGGLSSFQTFPSASSMEHRPGWPSDQLGTPFK